MRPLHDARQPPDHRALGLGDPYPPPQPPQRPQEPPPPKPKPPEELPEALIGQDPEKQREHKKLLEQEAQFDTMFERWENNFEQWKKDNEQNPDMVRNL